MSTLRVSVVSAERSLFQGEARMVVAPGRAGELGILPRHAPLLTTVRAGVLKIVAPDGEEEFIYISGGVLEAQPDGVTVLVDVGERGEDLDEARAEEARKNAEERIKANPKGADYAAAQAELAQAAAQLAAIRKLREKRR